MNTLIFDFNKTLFNPEANALYPDALSTCTTLKQRGYRLLLLSQEKPVRQDLISQLGLETLFDRIVLTLSKDEAAFHRMTDGFHMIETTVIGDGAEREIRIGHALGYQTVWVDRSDGAFAYPLSVAPPWRTIRDLHALLDFLP